jgi:hypothetical protein
MIPRSSEKIVGVILVKYIVNVLLEESDHGKLMVA